MPNNKTLRTTFRGCRDKSPTATGRHAIQFARRTLLIPPPPPLSLHTIVTLTYPGFYVFWKGQRVEKYIQFTLVGWVCDSQVREVIIIKIKVIKVKSSFILFSYVTKFFKCNEMYKSCLKKTIDRHRLMFISFAIFLIIQNTENKVLTELNLLLLLKAVEQQSSVLLLLSRNRII